MLDANGDSLKERTYKYLSTCSDENLFYDVKQTSDGGFIMVGESTDYCVGRIDPVQRGWLVKVDSNGCLFNDLQCWPTAVNETPNNTAAIKVYPNPAHDYLQAETTLNDAVIEQTDIIGRSLVHQKLSASSRIDLSGFSSGIYLYRVFSYGVVHVQGKVVKE